MKMGLLGTGKQRTNGVIALRPNGKLPSSKALDDIAKCKHVEDDHVPT